MTPVRYYDEFMSEFSLQADLHRVVGLVSDLPGGSPGQFRQSLQRLCHLLSRPVTLQELWQLPYPLPLSQSFHWFTPPTALPETWERILQDAEHRAKPNPYHQQGLWVTQKTIRGLAPWPLFPVALLRDALPRLADLESMHSAQSLTWEANQSLRADGQKLIPFRDIHGQSLQQWYTLLTQTLTGTSHRLTAQHDEHGRLCSLQLQRGLDAAPLAQTSSATLNLICIPDARARLNRTLALAYGATTRGSSLLYSPGHAVHTGTQALSGPCQIVSDPHDLLGYTGPATLTTQLCSPGAVEAIRLAHRMNMHLTVTQRTPDASRARERLLTTNPEWRPVIETGHSRTFMQ